MNLNNRHSQSTVKCRNKMRATLRSVDDMETIAMPDML